MVLLRADSAHYGRPTLLAAVKGGARVHATVPADQMDTLAADRMHRGHAIIEQVTADLKGCAPIHPPPNPRPDPTSR